MTPIQVTFLILFIIFAIVFLPIFYVLYLLSRPPKGNPKAYLKKLEGQGTEKREKVMIIGDSITQGNASANYVEMVENGLKGKGKECDVINAGINGNTTSDILDRIDPILKCNPTATTILIGTNDAKDSFNSAVKIKDDGKRAEKMEKDLYAYKDNLVKIINLLKEQTSSRIALLSIPPIGELPKDPAYILSQKYAGMIKEVASQQDIAYLPLNERMVEKLQENPGHPTYPYKKWFSMMFKAILVQKIMKKSYEAIGTGKGFRLHSDYLHMNEIGASMITEEILTFISKGYEA